MAHPRLVYCVEDLFTHCLTDYNVAGFRIAAYQRGYKWDAEVGRLLIDLRRAFTTAQLTGPASEYYLQYVTVKRQLVTGVEAAYLDVIDGQQRLTTLSLLFAVLAYQLPSFFNPTEGRLRYDVRENFVQEFVYAGRIARLLQPVPTPETAWHEFIAAYPAYDCQDVWYLLRAARTIHEFLGQSAAEGVALREFGIYVARRVMLIVNAVDSGISSEKVFRNLNSVKVYLTESELVKGLLLTRVAREPRAEVAAPTQREVVELRHTMGRQWDEMSRWLHQPAVAGFFGRAGLAEVGTERLLPLLELVAQHAGYTGPPAAPRQLHVFTYLQEQLRRGQSATYFFQRLRQLFSLLRSWYDTPELHNLLGFLFFSKEGGDKSQLLRQFTDERWLAAQQQAGISLTRHLKTRVAGLACLRLPAAKLRYHQDDHAIHDLLLLVNVFPEQPRQARAQLFDFASFAAGAWSLEHVFPQNPERDELRRLPPAEQQRVVQLIESGSQAMIGQLLARRKSWTERQREQWAEHFQLQHDLLDGIGNLALLDGGHNSTLRNALFAEKRRRIVQLVSKGAFVPPHTYNVFSRLLLRTGSGSATLWASEDMAAHTAYLRAEQTRLIHYLTTPA